jgi:hypothetical protein
MEKSAKGRPDIGVVGVLLNKLGNGLVNLKSRTIVAMSGEPGREALKQVRNCAPMPALCKSSEVDEALVDRRHMLAFGGNEGNGVFERGGHVMPNYMVILTSVQSGVHD